MNGNGCKQDMDVLMKEIVILRFWAQTG